MKHIHIILLSSIFLLLFSCKTAVKNSDNTFQEIKQIGKNLEIVVDNGKYIITPYNEQIVHTKFYPKNKEVKNFSYAVSMQPEALEYTIDDNGSNVVKVNSNGIDILITKKPFKIEYFYKDKLLISENKGFTQSDSTAQVKLNISEDELLYGGGARVLGMNRRGHRLTLYNRAHYGYETEAPLMNYTLPLFISSNQYAVLFDNASSGFLDLDSEKDNSVLYESRSNGTMNYFVVAGNDWYDLTDQYTQLTGRQPLPPRWAFGNFSSRFGYHTQKETETTVNQFFKDDIPLDAVIIDIYWFGPKIFDSMGNLDWLRDSFPNPEKMIADFDKKGVKTILVTEPFILKTSNKWEEAVDKGIICKDTLGNPYVYKFYFGNTGLIDIYDPKAKAWFWDIYKKFTNQGIGGWWGDLGEPEVHPADLQHINGTADDIHNAYGHEWAKMVYEGYQKDFPNQRPFILMRAGYAGSQRYGMIPWTGDVNRSWGGLKPQPEIALQMGMQGLAYMHSDLGGFAGGEKIDDELYVRWLQYGVFQPIYRPHAQEHIPAEPVFQKKATKDKARTAIQLRYKLLPYIYDMAIENHQSGKPLMIPLFFEESDNEKLLTYDESYLWGDDILVSPVKEKGKQKQEVYFPKGANWTDFYSGEQYTGGKSYTVDLKPDNIPTFIKNGAFLPLQKTAESTQNYNIKNLEIHYYHDKAILESKSSLLNDDGETPNAIKKGMSEQIDFTSKVMENNLTIEQTLNRSKWDGATTSGNYTLVVHNFDQEPLNVTINGKNLKPSEYTLDKKAKTIRFDYTWKGNTNIQLVTPNPLGLR